MQASASGDGGTAALSLAIDDAISSKYRTITASSSIERKTVPVRTDEYLSPDGRGRFAAR
jgi:hypothetical protein